MNLWIVFFLSYIPTCLIFIVASNFATSTVSYFTDTPQDPHWGMRWFVMVTGGIFGLLVLWRIMSL